MEASERKKNRWSATYTKHIKQKRKVYQDGFLDHFIITNKLMLFDEFEKLLECRVLKGEESVGSGESLTFNSYLVDVGDPEGHRVPVPGRDQKMPQQRKPSFLTRQKFTTPSISCGKENIPEKNNFCRNDLSPSQKIIREFKKSELQKYEAPKNGKDTVNLGPTEWRVLYTTQVTKKAKMYHDGFLRVANSGSFQKQVMLYDESRNLLTSRFLKKDEAVASGKSISMDGHLIEIGEAEEDRSRSVDVLAGQRDCYVDGKIKVMPGRQSCSKPIPIFIEDIEASDAQKFEEASTSGNITTHTVTEWQVMYTSQMTQKAKKYHDGFLKLENRGTIGRQIKLYDASQNILSSRHLKKDERICSGESIAFGGYLVDVGELEGDNQLLPGLNSENPPIEIRKPDRVNHTSIRSSKPTLKGESHGNDLPRQDFSSSSPKLERTKFVDTSSAKQPLRDASQILSVLKKPPQKNTAAECINQNQNARVSSIELLQASTAGNSVLFPVLGASETLTSMVSNNITNDFDGREENTSRYSRIPGGTEAIHSSQQNLYNLETSTKSSGEGLGSYTTSSATTLTRDGLGGDGGSSRSEQRKRSIEELPSFDLGF